MVSDPFKRVVGTSAVRAVHSDNARTALGFANEHTSAVLYYGHTSQLSEGKGFPILPKTSMFFNKGFGDEPELEFWLVSDTADTSVKIMEFYQEAIK